MNRRDLIKSGLCSFAAGQAVILPSLAKAQTLPAFDSIIKGLEISIDDFEKLSSLSRILINLRYVYQGPNAYENAEWRSQAVSAWESAFVDPTGINYFEFFQQSMDRREQFLNSEFGQFFISEIIEKYETNQAEFENWCSDIGISPESEFFNDLLASQALFATQFTSRNEELVTSEGGISFFDSVTWIWPFCGER